MGTFNVDTKDAGKAEDARRMDRYTQDNINTHSLSFQTIQSCLICTQASSRTSSFPIGEDSAKFFKCGGKMSVYFCPISKHFIRVDENPYHCEKCGICR
ncbi:unnamed protein product [Porites lobata]|uniref:CTCHY-type domain-containing protein n=1 Tax=Porites lobata TaxID=104759 RepID=A0ABN8RWY5_9CNID|nr:unnamed protein product [Porites lobata]